LSPASVERSGGPPDVQEIAAPAAQLAGLLGRFHYLHHTSAGTQITDPLADPGAHHRQSLCRRIFTCGDMAERQDRYIITGCCATNHHIHEPSTQDLWMDPIHSCHQTIDPGID
jgi:hypothetical protein